MRELLRRVLLCSAAAGVAQIGSAPEADDEEEDGEAVLGRRVGGVCRSLPRIGDLDRAPRRLLCSYGEMAPELGAVQLTLQRSSARPGL